MDRSAVKAIVEAHLPGLQKRFGLERFEIEVDYGPRENPNHEADCGRNVHYDKAYIGFDPEKYDDEAKVIRHLRHELFHVVLTPFDLFYQHTTIGLAGDDEKRADAIWTFSIEQCIKAMERLYDGLSSPSKGEVE